MKKSNLVEYQFEASAFQWEIAPGKSVAAWGFNGQVPGPTIRAKKGDTLVLRLKNNLSEPTIVHWHGIRLPAAVITGVRPDWMHLLANVCLQEYKTRCSIFNSSRTFLNMRF